MSTTAETIQYPAQPLFVECSGPPLLDQDQMLNKITTPPISTIKEEQCMLSDTESGHSLDDDDLYLGDSSYLSFPSDVTQTKVSNDFVESDSSRMPVPTFLVPVRNPETKTIQNVLVPAEVQDESGMNIIKSILMPIREMDGTVTYEIKKVVVPIKPELSFPKTQEKQPTSIKEKKSKSARISKGKTKLSDRRAEDDEMKKEDTKLEEPKEAESVEPKEEVDLILADLRTTCPLCQKSFKSELQMDRHVRREHQQPFRCKTCHYTFTMKEDLEKHMKAHEKDTYFQCPFCHLKYRKISGLRAHQIREHSNVDPVCIRDRIKEGLINNPEDPKSGTRVYVCQLCGNDYPKKSYLVAHKRIAHGHQRDQARRYKCHVCKKKFTFKHKLESHLCKDPGFLCAHCGMEFATNYTLQLHMRRHTGERPYQCTVCQKSFSRSVSLRVHKLTHTGERPYICDLCGQSFTQRSSMMVHRKKHPGNHPPPPPLLLSMNKSILNEEKV